MDTGNSINCQSVEATTSEEALEMPKTISTDGTDSVNQAATEVDQQEAVAMPTEEVRSTTSVAIPSALDSCEYEQSACPPASIRSKKQKVSEMNEIIQVQHKIKVAEINDKKELSAMNVQPASATEQSSTDPAAFCQRKIIGEDISLLLAAGPCQPQPGPTFSFPVSNGRSFQIEWYYRNLSDDTICKPRNWLTYSISTNRVFCLTCMLFGGHRASQTFTTQGWNDWTNGSRVLDGHETSKPHKAAEVERLQWLTRRTVGHLVAKHSTDVVQENRNVVSCMIDSVKYLAQEMIALRGHKTNSGKLYNLFKLIGKYSPAAASYICRIETSRAKNKKMDTNFLSHANTQLLLNVMCRLVVQEIVKEVKTHKKCSIIADGTYDSSKKEATVLLLRYIETDDESGPQPVERLIDVFTSGSSSGAYLCETILASLQKSGIDVQWVVGQGYDGAGNVRGKCAGLKTRIQKVNSKAVYVWCFGHRFNLVIEATVSCSRDVKNALGLLEELYVFFSGHKRNDAFMEAQKSTKYKHQLKRVVCTRWNSKQAAVETTLTCFGAILSAIAYLTSEDDMDSATISGALGISARLRDFRFVLTLHILKAIFQVAGPVSRQLQGVVVDLAMAAQLVTNCREQFAFMRDSKHVDDVWQSLVQEATNFAETHEINTVIVERRKIRKRMDGEESRDEAMTGLHRMKVEVFIPVLDEICAQMNDRFCDEQAQLLQEISLFSSGNLRRRPQLQASNIRILCSTYNFDAEAVAVEYEEFRSAYKTLEGQISNTSQLANSENNNSDTIDTSVDQGRASLNNFLSPLQLLSQLTGYPHLLRVYWTLLTLPVTSCSAERALSKLRIVKNRLRSTMSDPWLKSLMILAAEKDLVDKLSNDAIIDCFAQSSNSLKQLLLFR